MSQISATFKQLQQKGRKALMPYLTLGYPRLESALDLVPALVEGGADLVELGVPEEAIPRMAEAAMKVTRLLKNNLREVTAADAEAIYRAAY